MGQNEPARILVVDDAADARDLVRLWFDRDRRYSIVAEAAGIAEALDILASTDVDVVLTDLVVGSKRLDAVELMAATPSHPLIVVFSAHDRSIETDVLDSGAVAFFEKTDIGAIPDALEQLLEARSVRT